MGIIHSRHKHLAKDMKTVRKTYGSKRVRGDQKKMILARNGLKDFSDNGIVRGFKGLMGFARRAATAAGSMNTTADERRVAKQRAAYERRQVGFFES